MYRDLVILEVSGMDGEYTDIAYDVSSPIRYSRMSLNVNFYRVATFSMSDGTWTVYAHCDVKEYLTDSEVTRIAQHLVYLESASDV